MSIKKLFGKSFRGYESASVDVESPAFINNTVAERETYLPPIDFATASNFVKYGSAELYYEKSISRIYDDFPYDGSKAEKIMFHQSSSYLDRWMYEMKYPKTTGYVTLGKTADYTGVIVGGYGKTNTNEYIRTWGGLHTASSGMIGNPIQNTFGSSIIYDAELNRTQNWAINPVSGTTVEFWLQKPAYDPTDTEREVIVDLWNGKDPGTEDYARFLLEIDCTSAAAAACIELTYQSGTTTGVYRQSVSSTDVTLGSLQNWHHYTLSVISASAGGVDVRFYKDGAEDRLRSSLGTWTGLASIGEFDGLLTGFMGAIQHKPYSGTPAVPAGSGKFSGSLDEFRFWKTRRTSRQIELNWFRQVGGGANTDKNTTDLGIYYKFNEGIVGSTAIDQTVLDYSGRLANGYWQGYATGARSTNSGLQLSSHNLTESKTPIIYSFHPEVTALETEMTTSGSDYDNQYGSSLYFSMPNWILEEDEESNKNLKYVSQILASYFDTLYAQITALSDLKNKGYLESQYKAPPFARQLLESKGFITKDLFTDSKIVELFSSADFDAIKFEKSITETKNLIYLNIYNNLEKIYKSKGTEKSIRNFIRCFGIDDEIIKLNMYTDGGTHYFTDKAKGTSVKKKYLNFNSSSFFGSTIFQTTGSSANPITFISGSDASTISASWGAFTFEADVVIPAKKSATEIGYFNTPFLSSSIFGFHEANESESESYTWNKPEVANLQVYLTRDKLNSKTARLTLKNQDGTINWASPYIQDVYDNDHWNMAIRIKPNNYPYAGNVATSSAPAYTLDFYAVNYNFDEIENLVTASFALNSASGSAYISRPKRVYAGAHLTNFTGAVDTRSDIQLGAIRVWYDYLSGSSIQQHNLDPLNFGTRKTYGGSNIFLMPDRQIGTEELTVLNWDFDTVTGSTSAGEFTIDDITSGSSDTIYGWIDNIIRREYKGLGRGFGASNSAFLENEFLYAQKKELPEISFTNDNVFVKTESDISFIKDDDVSDNFFLLEKSMNQIVSEEMLKLFSTVHEFSNLIGRPVDGYRQNYKALDKIRQDFYSRVESDSSLETFLNYYKWIDSSISKMIQQLVPASVNFGPGVIDVVESHILERNKYQRRVGLLNTVESTEGTMLGVNDLTYNWKYGHAPVGEKKLQNSVSVEIGQYANPIDNNLSGNLAQPMQETIAAFWYKHPDMSGKTNTAVAMFMDTKGTQYDYRSHPIRIDADESYSSGDVRMTIRLYSNNSTSIYRTYLLGNVAGGAMPGNQWNHFAFSVKGGAWTDPTGLTMFVNGVSASAVSVTDTGVFAGNQQDQQSVHILPAGTGGGGFAYSLAEVVLITGSHSNAANVVNELYNNGEFISPLDLTTVSPSDVKVWWRMGNPISPSYTAGAIAQYQRFNDYSNNSNFLERNGSSAGINTVSDSYGTTRPFVLHDPFSGSTNCLWQKEREIRTGTNSSDREKIRKVLVNQTNATSSTLSTISKAVYQGSTYIPRALGTPYKLSIDFSDSIHGGTNYSKQKNREFLRTAVWIRGKVKSSAPVNIMTVGLGTGYGIVEKKRCDDVYDPNKKDYLNLEVEVGKYAATNAVAALSSKEEYMYKLPSHMVWPFNMKSGSLSTGYNRIVSSSFKSTTILTNLHSDTIDITNEISMQGPFTEAHVGGNQNRHIALNKYASGSISTPAGLMTPNGLQYIYTRPEAWALLFGANPLRPGDPDGAMGFTGPDYGSTYPDTSKKLAIWYREERAKRPVNIKNIQSTTASAVLGNYQHPYEFLSTFSNQKRYLTKFSGSSLLPSAFTTDPYGITALGYIEITDSTNVHACTFWLDDLQGTTGEAGSPGQRFQFLPGTNGSIQGGSVTIRTDGLVSVNTSGNRASLAENLAAAVNIAQGNGWTNITATSSGQIVTVRQSKPGIAGNLAIRIVSAKSGVSFTDFTGGTEYERLPLKETTNYMTLIGQAPFMSGNVFGIPNNNRQPATDALPAPVAKNAQGIITFNIETWPGGGSNYSLGLYVISRANSPTIDEVTFCPLGGPDVGAQGNPANGELITTVGAYQGNTAVIWSDTTETYVRNLMDAMNGVNGYQGNLGVCSLTASVTTDGLDVFLTIKEKGQMGGTGNSGTFSIPGAIQGAVSGDGSGVITGGRTNPRVLGANDIVIEIPRTDLTSSKNTITTRFSAPGGPEVNSRGYLDIATGQYSAYNSMNYRNYTVRSSGSGESWSSPCSTQLGNYETIRVNSNIGKRDGMQTLLRRHCGKFGADSQHGSVTAGTYVTVPAFYKQHRNSLVTPRITSATRRKGINNVETTENNCSLSASISPHWQPTRNQSFSFWYKNEYTSVGTQYLADIGSPSGQSSWTITIEPANGSIYIYQGLSNDAVTTYHRIQQRGAETPLITSIFTGRGWHFITIVREQNNLIPRLYIDGMEIPQGRALIHTVGDPTISMMPLAINKITLLDLPTSNPGYELQGALANFALWDKALPGSEAKALYQMDGVATGLNGGAGLKEYWSLGEESTLAAIAAGSPIPSKTLLPSPIGGTALTVNDMLSCSVGPYDINITSDTRVYNNMSMVSLLPQSTFQYAWINAAISGSNNWMSGQKIRGYAPKSGEIRIVGGGSPTHMVPAINFPTASALYGE